MVNNRMEVLDNPAEPITYKNRIAKYLDLEPITNNGGISNNEPGTLKREPEPTCESCKWQREGICNRYPGRYTVKTAQGFMIACGDYQANEI